MNSRSILDALEAQRTTLMTNFQAALVGPAMAAASLRSLLSSAAKSFPNFEKHKSSKNPAWARISHRFDLAMSVESIEERLAGIPVYALSNSAEEFVLVSGVKSGKSLGIFCLKEDDAEGLLSQMKIMDPGMRQGSRVVAVALNKVFQLKVDGVAFRLVPDPCQIRNAIKVKEQDGSIVDGFSGVPVFQSKSLVLKSKNKKYRPLFFRKEDLELYLCKASQQQNKLNPSLRLGDIQVSVLEDIVAAMKTGSTSKWDDVVFIPPGFDGGVGPVEREGPVVSA
ncbi:tic22-like family protein [Wolffia australiana]